MTWTLIIAVGILMGTKDFPTREACEIERLIAEEALHPRWSVCVQREVSKENIADAR